MTLVVSVRIPDGVVLAVDSLSTVGGAFNFAMNADFKCKSCGTPNEVKNLQLPQVAFPISTKSAAQKLVGFKGKFGIAFFGNSFVNKKSLLSQIKSLEAHVQEDITSVDKVAEKVLYHFEKEMKAELGEGIAQLAENAVPFGFQIVGFDSSGVGKTWVVTMGRQPTKYAETELGTTLSGDVALLMRLMQPAPGGGLPLPQPNLLSFSLQDAVDYAKFLIRFVADYQRFANMIPSVGGDIDVALVTGYSDLKWIERKKISQLLEE
jgi:hypothetical protein